MPGVAVMRGTAPARVAVGLDEAPGPGDVRVWVHTPTGNLGGELKIEDHALTADLQPRVNELSGLTWGEVPALGKPLIRVGGKVVAALQGRELHVGVDVNLWQKGLASFPIFWVNVLDFAHQATPGLTIIRSGEQVQVPPGSFVPTGPPGIERDLTPEGRFIGYMTGSYRLSDLGGYKQLVVNLLDERESDTAGKSQDLQLTASTAPQGRMRADLSGSAAWCALAFLVLAWLLQVRPE